jgi:hypothetical protein
MTFSSPFKFVGFLTSVWENHQQKFQKKFTNENIVFQAKQK